MSDRTARMLINLGLLELWMLIYPRLSAGCGMLVFFKNKNLLEFLVLCLALSHLFSVIASSVVVPDGKSFHEYLVNSGVPQGSILIPKLFLLYLNDLPDNFICNIGLYTDDTTLCSPVRHLTCASN